MKNKFYIVGFLFLAFGFASACSSASKKQTCKSQNWEQKGKQDGLKGKNVDVIMKKQKQCAKYDIQIPLKNYKKGWLIGIKTYCSEDNGKTLGAKGKKLNIENCPIEYRPKFEAAYQKGLKIKDLEAKLKSVDSEIKGLGERHSSLENEIASKKNKLNKLEKKKTRLENKRKDLLEEKRTY